MGGLMVLLGFAVFFLVEKFVRSHHAGHAHGGHSHGHAHAHDEGSASSGHACCEMDHDHGEHSHGHDEAATAHEHGHSDASSSTGLRKRRSSSPAKSSRAKSPAKSPAKPAAKSPAKRGSKKADAHDHDHAQHEHGHSEAVAPTKPETATKRESRIAGYLNLAADAAHNFTDGLLIGGSYSKGFGRGVATTLACIMHEVRTPPPTRPCAPPSHPRGLVPSPLGSSQNVTVHSPCAAGAS